MEEQVRQLERVIIMEVLVVVLCLEVEQQENIGVVEDLIMVDLVEEGAVTMVTTIQLLLELGAMVDLVAAVVEVKVHMILYFLTDPETQVEMGVLEACLQVMVRRVDWVMLRPIGVMATILPQGLVVEEQD